MNNCADLILIRVFKVGMHGQAAASGEGRVRREG